MASERFYFWRGYWNAMRRLSMERRGEMITALCQWAFDGEEPDFSGDEVLDFAWQILSEQVAESVDIGRRMAERGRRSGESRRKKSGKDEHRSNTVPNTVPNERKGTEVTSTESASASSDASALAPDGARRASSPQLGALPPRPSGDG